MSRSKVEVTRDKKRTVHSHHPRQQWDEMRSLQITSCSSRQDHSNAVWGVISVAYVLFIFGKTSLALVTGLVFESEQK